MPGTQPLVKDVDYCVSFYVAPMDTNMQNPHLYIGIQKHRRLPVKKTGDEYRHAIKLSNQQSTPSQPPQRRLHRFLVFRVGDAVPLAVAGEDFYLCRTALYLVVNDRRNIKFRFGIAGVFLHELSK